jgi:hypothetical protein
MYPEYSIGKLVAAKVNYLERNITSDKKVFYKFSLYEYSINVKINPGDVMILVPEELRDRGSFIQFWDIKIRSIRWNDRNQCYDVVTHPLSKCYITILREEFGISTSKQWFIYPKGLDTWSGKLFNQRSADLRPGLLQILNFGTSWLGRRLTALWGIKPDYNLPVPSTTRYNLHELYAFAPNLINSLGTSSIDELQSPLYPPPDPSQLDAIRTALSNNIVTIHGPPGTGKSQTIITIIDEYLHLNDSARILVTSFSYSAMMVILDKLINSTYKEVEQLIPSRAARLQKFFLRSDHRNPLDMTDTEEGAVEFVHDLVRAGNTWRINGQSKVIAYSKTLENYLEDNFILFANAFQLWKLRERKKSGKLRCVQPDFAFDLIIVDEASQMPADQILTSLQFVNQGEVELQFHPSVYDEEHITEYDLIQELVHDPDQSDLPHRLSKVIIVGDQNQLPPVQPIKPPEKLRNILSSVFQYYAGEDTHSIISRQLATNYRSHRHIVEFTASLGYYKNLRPHADFAERVIHGDLSSIGVPWVCEVLEPSKVVETLVHDGDFEVAVSLIEAELTINLILGYYRMLNPDTKEKQRKFWSEEVGVVAPHNAQGRLIIQLLYRQLSKNDLSLLGGDELMESLRNTIYSVEKFQGSDRSFIIATIGISSKDKLSQEEDFIYDLERFNVLTSRAKSKVVLISSRNFLDYFPTSRDKMEHAAQIRYFAMDFCQNTKNLTVEGQDDNSHQIEFRWKSDY